MECRRSQVIFSITLVPETLTQSSNRSLWEGKELQGSWLEYQTKSTCHLLDFTVPVDHREKVKEIENYLDLAKELTKTVEYNSEGHTNCNECAWKSPKGFGKKTGMIQNQRSNRDHADYSKVKIGWST